MSTYELASKTSVMGPFISGVKTRWFGWIGAGIMGLAVLMMLWDVWLGIRFSLEQNLAPAARFQR